MVAEVNRSGRQRRYNDEDTSPTSERELLGFYSYGLAAEVFAVCGVGSFLPITLEQLAREHGVLKSNKSVSCIPKADEKGEDGVQAAAKHLFRRAKDGDGDNVCVVQPFGREVTTASFAMYTFSIAVLVQAICLISFSSVADYGTYRKKLLLVFGIIGAVASMLFIIVTPPLYLLGSLLVIVGVTSLGSSFVLLNSFLPLLAANHPSVTASLHDHSNSVPLENLSSQGSAMLDEHPVALKTSKEMVGSPELQLSTRISAKGVGIGYIAAVFVQCLSILMLFGLSKANISSATIPLRVVLFLVGTWWLGFTLPSAIWLQDRPGPPLHNSPTGTGVFSRCMEYIVFAWHSVWSTVKIAIQLRQVVIFLIAWFLLSDAIATVSGTAILFARTELKMDTVPIAILSIVATSSGIAGAFVWPIISRKLGLQTNQTIICCIALMEIIPIYGLIGYLPLVKSWGVGGLQKAWEIYPLGFIHGFVMGGLSSYCRSFYGLLIPPGSEAAFYALYAITDKGSSAVGPAIVGMIVDSTGTIRPAFGFLAILIVLPLPLVWLVDAQRGREDAIEMVGAIKARKMGPLAVNPNSIHDPEDTERLFSGHE